MWQQQYTAQSTLTTSQISPHDIYLAKNKSLSMVSRFASVVDCRETFLNYPHDFQRARGTCIRKTNLNQPWPSHSPRTHRETSVYISPQTTNSKLPQEQRPSVLVMSSYGGAFMPQINQSELTQLNDLSDFELLLSSDERLSICGFGSLLSERSARSTFTDLTNFRLARLNGFRRVFAHAAPIFFQRGIAKPQTKEISSLSVEPCQGESLIVTVFEIQRSEVPSFIEREHEFRFLAVVPETLDGIPFTSPAVLCARYTDEEYFEIRCKGSKEIYFQNYGRYNIDKIWRDDIFPCRVYLRHCVMAAKNLGDEAYNNFLDHTYLGDRKTTIRKYLASKGSGIMEEEPPEPLKTRYGG